MAKRKAFTAFYDDESGELINIEMAPGLEQSSASMRADVLQDVLGEIASAYRSAWEEAFPDASPRAKNIAEQFYKGKMSEVAGFDWYRTVK